MINIYIDLCSETKNSMKSNYEWYTQTSKEEDWTINTLKEIKYTHTSTINHLHVVYMKSIKYILTIATI